MAYPEDLQFIFSPGVSFRLSSFAFHGIKTCFTFDAISPPGMELDASTAVRPGQLAPVVLILVVGYYLVSKVVAYFRLRKFGGPKWSGITDVPHSRAMLRGNCHLWYAEANKKYGQSIMTSFLCLRCRTAYFIHR